MRAIDSPDYDNSDDDAIRKPAKKMPAQSSLNRFFDTEDSKKKTSPSRIAGMKPKPKPATVRKATSKRTVDSDEDEDPPEASHTVVQRSEAPRRAARAAPKKYIEIGSDDDDDDDVKDDTFETSD